MSLQDVYYIISIIATVVFIGVMLFIGFIFWQIYLTVKSIERYLKKDVIERVENFVNDRKAEVASVFSMGVGTFLLNRAKNYIQKKIRG